jgi:hypothetical protein
MWEGGAIREVERSFLSKIQRASKFGWVGNFNERARGRA